MKKLLGVLLVLVYSCTTTNDGNTTTTTVVPLPPTNLVGTLSPPTTINLSWIDNSTNETGFKIERKLSGGDYILIGTTDANKTTFSDSGLSIGVTYTYRVYAYNTVGDSLTYIYSLEIKTANVPILTTTLAPLTFGGSAASGGNITDNGGSDVTARGVVWSTNSSPTIDLSTKTIDGSGNGVFTSAITGLTAGTTYYVRAYATNSAGTAYGNQITFIETAVPSDGLVGYWPFNGNANDMSGNGHNGTVNGATLATDRFGNTNSAYSFITNSDIIQNEKFDITTQNFTISVWCKVLTTFKYVGFNIVEFGPIDHITSGGFSLGLDQNDSAYGNNMYKLIGVANNTVYSQSLDFNSINKWNNFIFSKDDGIINLYLNGQLLNSKIDSEIINYANSYLQFGNYANINNNLVGNRLIDDIGIWNRALTQAEITALYNSTGK